MNISASSMVVTSTYVTEEHQPILLISHEDDEEDGSLWQFHCGNRDYDMSKMILVRFDTVLNIDPSVKEVVKKLSKGCTAVRFSQSAEWKILEELE